MTAPFRVRVALFLVPVVGVVVMLAAAAPAGAASVVEHQLSGSAQAGYRSAREFWTPRRLEAAKPMQMPSVDVPAGQSGVTGPTPPSRARGADGKPEYIEGQEPTVGPLARAAERNKLPKHPKIKSAAVPPALYGVAPIRSNGKLYMAYGKKLYSCSATVVPSKTHTVILTAGHCIFNKKQRFADNVAFIPGYFGGRSAHGFWGGIKIVTNGQWVKRTNEKYDYAAIKVAGPQGRIGNVVGEAGLAINAGRHNAELALGYPNNRGRTQVMWSCRSRLIGDDPFNRGKGKKNLAIGCDMSHGCSGGSWEVKRKGRYYVNSVSSYFYDTPRFNNILFGPYLTGHAKKVVHRANKG